MVYNAVFLVFLGVVRGCGRQKIGAYINLGSYYIVGIPCAVLFAFVLNIGGKVLYFSSTFFIGFAFYLISTAKNLILTPAKYCFLKGLWMGIICGLILQGFFFLVVVARINWNEEV